MRWRRWAGDGDSRGGADAVAGVQRRLVRVIGPAPGVYGLSAEPEQPRRDPAAGTDCVVTGDPVETPDPAADPVAARRALAAFDPGRRGLKALAVVAVIVVVVVGVVVWRARPQAQSVGGSGPALVVSAAPSAPAGIVVAVAGQVHRPGLVRLPAGSRVADAIEAAGGVLPGTDLRAVNLARKVIDGELLVVGASGSPGAAAGPGPGPAPGPGPGSGAGPGAPINLNMATAAELDTLPGVGPVLAQRIIDYRTRTGGFRSVDELRKVEGVGDARYAQLKDLVTV